MHRLRVTLLDVTPPVWRELRVPSALTLDALHLVLQVAMGWENRHLHEFRIGDAFYDDESGENLIVLGDAVGPDDVLRYDYDLGDGWEHLVEVLAVEPYDGTVVPLAVLAGARSAPPEDCGGPSGYEHLIDALRNPSDPEHDELMEWVGDAFDPEFFDRGLLNRRLEPFWRVS